MGGWIEGLVFAAFALGWGVIELVALSLDRKRQEHTDADSGDGDDSAAPGAANPPGAASAPPASPGSSATRSAAMTDSRGSP